MEGVKDWFRARGKTTLTTSTLGERDYEFVGRRLSARLRPRETRPLPFLPSDCIRHWWVSSLPSRNLIHGITTTTPPNITP